MEEVLRSSLTMEKVAAAKKFIENHYPNHNNIQERVERHWVLERKLASSDVPKKVQVNLIKDLERKGTEFMRMKRNKIEKKSGNIYAMKKTEMVKKGQSTDVRWNMSEQRETCFVEVASHYIMKLYYSFQDAEYLYLIMEYLPGGDTMNLLIREDTLTESVARFYIAQSALAMESIHKHVYIHRDIKLDNLILD
ncbi:hypothetical protein SAY87_019167 [Trapa incisa]|uniref:non-specific serine/threonine protein kinase n=1 Tax=Trapa incisa TaxID=236973 RepID=A0AAN7K3L1_9MYRT|nr:hypothetical protein SAY87_019167 [Trapa incisa]